MSSKADHSASSGMFPSIRLPSFLWNSHRNFLQYCTFRRYFLTKITAQPAVQYCKREAFALSVPKNYRLFEAIILLNPCLITSNYHFKGHLGSIVLVAHIQELVKINTTSQDRSKPELLRLCVYIYIAKAIKMTTILKGKVGTAAVLVGTSYNLIHPKAAAVGVLLEGSLLGSLQKYIMDSDNSSL